MLIRHNYTKTIPSNEITPESVYKERRELMKLAASAVALAATPLFGALNYEREKTSRGLKPTSFDQITTYNNFYEYSTDKESPARLAKNLKTRPWTMSIGGEVQKKVTLDIDQLLKLIPAQERIYRFRCVEGWSMVVPWVGIPLASVLKHVGLTSKSKFVEFQTLFDPKQFPAQRESFGSISFPYREGLRIDEAMNPLTLLAVGLYGKELLPQNGAPIRLVVPWKYGFKSIKSIVSITLRETPSHTTWNDMAPKEYGFFANVNPTVDHPRWSQARERPLGSFFKQDTLMFNGYEKEVAHMYKGVNLRKFF
ncbi:MAG TPA: protein-methionine-sulfoxide reductase catalytic subunit MsrP [Sulfuricurvum sp.]|nr:MAG: mononuclear molybdenum enzyme YedY [Campylobacterales bacterium 16-40-21]OYZ65632.1 MAG: mononuclear molybdenum enzyme YedY [Sulfuricurvum sp. 24-42-5]OZA03354.1 MAG: mononuclear molybdenum enzyme YedY [Sulfuricurvum sp. 17-40-25]HQS66542.1 protein-methionine-sulfoxide reductase catalytic subunit MsrP [Sulfuricurvum sp.]HQT35385.1 protein-methionine-sulfoxide reductase catalytic subunit MsrP [Sulfuricurvum sp.]